MEKTITVLSTAALSASLLSGYVSTSQNTAMAQSTETSPADTSSANGSSADKTDKFTAESSTDSASYTIRAGQLAEHGSLDNCCESFMASLEEEGTEEGVNLTVLYDNSQADSGTTSQTTTDFIGKGVDLMCGVTTPMAQAEYGVAKKSDIPVILTAITDPVAVELVSVDGTSTGEVTDTNDKLPMEAQLRMIRETLPEAKNIGIMYIISEVNSESAIAEYEEPAPQYGFETVDTGASSSADTVLTVSTLINKVDCITNPIDNTVVAPLPVILDKTTTRNIPVLGSEVEQAKIGCLAAIGLDYIELGKQTGRMAAQILHGEEKAGEMNYETIKEAAFYGSTRAAGNLGIALLGDLTKNAAELFTGIIQ